MAAALADHLTAVLQSLRFPDVVADVLPAGHLHKDQKAQLVAGIEEGGAGGRGEAHGVAAQLLFQELGVQPLAVEVEPACHELQGAEAEPAAFLVQHPVGQAAGAGTDEPDGQGVKGGVLDAPRMDAVQCAGDGQRQLAGVERPAARGAAYLSL